jgi:hypothetical protein
MNEDLKNHVDKYFEEALGKVTMKQLAADLIIAEASHPLLILYKTLERKEANKMLAASITAILAASTNNLDEALTINTELYEQTRKMLIIIDDDLTKGKNT